MEEEQNICIYCNIRVEDEVVEDEQSFEELATELQNSRPQYVIYNEENKLNKAGIIKWLLQNATKKNIESSDIDKIVDQCAYINETEILELLKFNGILIEIPKSVTEVSSDAEELYDCAILYAVKLGTPEIITWLLSFQVNYNISKHVVNALLHSAAEEGNLNTIKKLVELGANVYHLDSEETESILETSVKNGYNYVVEWLINNKINGNDLSCLHGLQIAIENKQYDIIKLLTAGTYFNINDRKTESASETLIHLAAQIGNISLIQYLEDYGCSLWARDGNNRSIVHFAAYHGHLNLLKWLHTRQANLTALSWRNCSPLHKAAEGGELECVKYLVHKNSDVNIKTIYGKSVLHLAVESENIEMVKFLIAHGANPLTIDNEQNTLLHASQSNVLYLHSTFELVILLTSYNIDLYATNAEGHTLLKRASKRNDVRTVKWLLEQGMSVNDVLNTATTWLTMCNSQSDWSMLLLCIEYMGNINILIEGETLLYKAASYPEAVKILVQNNADVNKTVLKDGSSPLIHSLFDDYWYLDGEAAQILMENGADVNVVTKYGYTALYHAVTNNKNVSVVKKLIDLGANVNAASLSDHVFILNAAAIRGDLEIIKCLVEAGANLNSNNIHENSAITQPTTNVNKWEIIKYLVEKGTDVNYYTSRPVLFDAVQTGDVELVAFLLQHGAHANIVVPNEVSILHKCSCIADDDIKLKILQLLIRHGANINGSNYTGETILFSCINNKNIVDYLLEMGIDINQENQSDSTVLHESLRNEHFVNNIKNQSRIVLKLINHGSNINHCDIDENTPLHLAVANPHCSDIVRLLVQKGASLIAVNKEKSSILHETCLGELGMWLISKGADVNAKNNQGVTVLQKAIQHFPKESVNCSRNVVTSLVNRCTKNEPISSTTLDSINTSRYIEYVHVLIDKVGDVNITNDDGLCALHYVVPTDNVAILDHLFKKGANLLSRTKEGNTVLHLAASQGSIKIVTYILVEMNHVLLFKGNNANETPLHLAVASNHENIVKLLLNHAIDIDQQNNSGITALQIACQNNYLEIVKLLVSKCASLNEIYSDSETPIHIALKYYNFEIFKYLAELENHKLIEVKNSSGQTLLHLAVKCVNLKIIDKSFLNYILEKQLIPVNCVDKFGNSPLHYACKTYAFFNVELLIDNGAGVNLKNKTGNTPLHFAAVSCHRDIVGILMENGANAKLKNNKGNTPINIAAAHRCTEISDLIIEKTEDLYIKNRKGNCAIHQAAVSTTNNVFTRLILDHPLMNLNVINHKKRTPLQLTLKLQNKCHPNIINCISRGGINNRDMNGNTALHDAIIITDIEGVRFKLLQNGANLSNKNNNEESPIHLAMSLLKKSDIKRLLPFITNVNITDKLGWNVVHVVIQKLDLESLQMIFNLADVNAKTKSRQTYLHVALNQSCTEKLKWLIPKCKSVINERELHNGHTVLHQCILSDCDVEIVKLLLENGADINAVDYSKNSALHLATENSSSKLIKFLILNKINLDLANRQKETALHIAVKRNNIHAFGKLCVENVNINAVNLYGQTALHIAVHCKNLALVIYLVENLKCDHRIKDKKGRTAYAMAMLMNDNADIVNWFVHNCLV